MTVVNSKPDFLGIGMQRAGTTWLWSRLRTHPNVWMPPLKELHYFSRSPKYPSRSHLDARYPIIRLLRPSSGLSKLARRELTAAFRAKDWGRLRWTLRYLLGPYNDAWYLSLFRDGRGKVKGEITPAYAMLEPEDVKHVRELLPDLKIILLLRNPMDRAWSHARRWWMEGRLRDMHALDEIKAFIDSSDQTLRSDYIRTIDIWGNCFPRERLFIGFYDEIVHNPEGLLSRMGEFLGIVGPLRYENSGDLRERVNPADSMEIPSKIRRYLAEKYCPDLEQLSHLVGGYSQTWLSEAKRILGAVK
jgi:hypothetical protein